VAEQGAHEASEVAVLGMLVYVAGGPEHTVRGLQARLEEGVHGVLSNSLATQVRQDWQERLFSAG
jgi:hypothetical protein